MYTIYIIQNLLNNKLYVGQTNNLKRRIKNHRCDTKTHKYNSLLHAAIRKYGWNNFKVIEIEQWETLADINEAEKFWIEFFRTNINKFGLDYGYNLTEGGEGVPGRKPSVKTIESLRQRSIGNNWGSKVVHTDEFKAQIGKRYKGKKLSDEHKKKVSITRKEKGIAKGSKNPSAKLNENIVAQIRYEYSTGISSRALGRKYSVSKTTILRIVNNKNWKQNE